MLQDVKRQLNKWEDILCLWIKIPNIVKIPSLYPKWTYTFNTIPIKIPKGKKKRKKVKILPLWDGMG